MHKHEMSQAADNTSSPRQHGELSAHVHTEAGFSHVGDNSGNQAWSQMTGAGQWAGEAPLSHGAQTGANRDSIDCGAYGDIYAQSNSRSHEGLAPSGAENHVPFNADIAKYDGKQFYDMSLHEARNTPTDTLNKVNQNNYDNLHQRMSDIHEKMPDVVMRGVDSLGKDDMEKLAHKSAEPLSEHARGGEYFAYSLQKPKTPEENLDHLASHLTKAQAFADGVDRSGGVYAFAYTPKIGRTAGEQKYIKDLPEPFKPSVTSGEAILSLDKSNLSHIATLSGEEVYIPHDLRLDRTITPAHIDALEGYRTTKGVDKVMSGIESKHADYLASVRRQRETQERIEFESHEAGWCSRISNTLKSWF